MKLPLPYPVAALGMLLAAPCVLVTAVPTAPLEARNGPTGVVESLGHELGDAGKEAGKLLKIGDTHSDFKPIQHHDSDLVFKKKAKHSKWAGVAKGAAVGSLAGGAFFAGKWYEDSRQLAAKRKQEAKENEQIMDFMNRTISGQCRGCRGALSRSSSPLVHVLMPLHASSLPGPRFRTFLLCQQAARQAAMRGLPRGSLGDDHFTFPFNL
ncbi:hypothetical protein IE81DRAFT_238334 [Ceraceosorus guamensis]|uniref:Uncharacterized protein n=1 Tax=Ceraceosorus guamensis TaxID=1522189 RepID=A0A316VR80_9BASI|nr:hypothetical protein IE81DRAFT_238334 [Ceraceosorus guamensis]PWN40117.1 hypothetical protein IE81DRAFT_238334 [Ceraceosorus guamensis]